MLQDGAGVLETSLTLDWVLHDGPHHPLLVYRQQRQQPRHRLRVLLGDVVSLLWKGIIIQYLVFFFYAERPWLDCLASSPF